MGDVRSRSNTRGHGVQPYDAATGTIARARALLSHANQVGLPAGVPGDLRRMSVVMALAALDAFMHRLVVSSAYEHKAMPGGLAALTVTFDDLITQADAGVDARKADKNARPRVAAKRILRDRLLRETFQRYEDVARALSMAGKPKQWQNIAAKIPGSPTKEAVRDRLNTIVDRRNAIVHEGDYERLERPQTAKLVPITAGEARTDVDFLADVIDAIHAIL